MALDGIYLYSLINNFKDYVINAKIDKVNQPEKDEIVLTLRKDRKNYKLLISACAKYPRIHFTNTSKPNPIQAPMFTMVLRKYLTGGKIINVEQVSMDRIVKIEIESKDELGFNSLYFLIVEIMGRHSNITLVRERDNKIMECIKHITCNVNSYRVLYPGVSYVYPPNANKLNPYNFTKEDFNNFIKDKNIEFSNNIFSEIFTGFSKTLSSNLYFEISNNKDNLNYNDVYEFTINFIKNLSSNISHRIYSSNSILKDFYCIPLPLLENTCSKELFNTPNELMDEFYKIKDKQERLHNRSIGLQRLINTNIDRCNKKSLKLDNILKECSSKGDYKIKGDLLTAYIYSFKKGDKEVSVLNYYSTQEEYMEIPLDENKTPSENVQFYYKKYNKLKKSEESAIEQSEKNNEELIYLNSVLTNILNCDNYTEIEDIKKELIETGYLKFKKSNKSSKKDKASKPLHFVSSEGIDIYVGKNNLQNDYLSLKFAKKNYIWLHTKNIPGSHVIVCCENLKEKTLEEAAILAGFYSKARNSTKVPVDYTKVKNLKKPSGSKPGMVIYHTNYTMYIEPSDYNKFSLENNKITINKYNREKLST